MFKIETSHEHDKWRFEMSIHFFSKFCSDYQLFYTWCSNGLLKYQVISVTKTHFLVIVISNSRNSCIFILICMRVWICHCEYRRSTVHQQQHQCRCRSHSVVILQTLINMYLSTFVMQPFGLLTLSLSLTLLLMDRVNESLEITSNSTISALKL